MPPALHLQLLFMSDDTDIKGAAPKAKHPHYCIVADAEAKEVRFNCMPTVTRHTSSLTPQPAQVIVVICGTRGSKDIATDGDFPFSSLHPRP